LDSSSSLKKSKRAAAIIVMFSWSVLAPLIIADLDNIKRPRKICRQDKVFIYKYIKIIYFFKKYFLISIYLNNTKNILILNKKKTREKKGTITVQRTHNKAHVP